ncbi:pimeloyl-ACP methyl ester carboxylesterase [Isoptericola jiangsuensis]|uniref:Pimeloyl-ACP methyl ester carboxylesterase n=1 Tax=Isoptericola jiangsuensis TaxID=548579 RepID=A0A2A9EVW0_9MICO|nr:alpha/beta hydrolase [Isoptericola jiangsuensis]PFG42706.1 pimeloyl-ACP methyl ester carboxylesterase [Isoptericola jiangsuensis]
MTQHVTSTAGDQVGFDRYGDGPAVVFVAGAGPFRAVDPLTTRTAQLVAEQGLTAVVYDRLGRGDSPADGVLDLDREVSALGAVIDVAGVPAVLVGHSSGCAIALAAADVEQPVAGLLLWEAPLAGSLEEVAAWSGEFERRLDAEDYVGATEQYMRDMPPEWLAAMKAAPEFEVLARASRSQRADGQAMVRATELLETGALRELSVPVLATYGTSTFPEMPVAAQRVAEVATRGRVEEVPGEGHSWDAEAMAARIVQFVRHEL